MGLLRSIKLYLQFRLAPDPVDNSTDEIADAVNWCGWFRFPCEEPGFVADDEIIDIDGVGPCPAAIVRGVASSPRCAGGADSVPGAFVDRGGVPTPPVTSTFHDAEK